MATSCKLFLFVLAFVLMMAGAWAHEFQEFPVGGPGVWAKPGGNETESYNHWARRSRFHVGDSIYFKYKNDSVLVVDRDDYSQCNTRNPLLKFTDGNTKFEFNRYGFFYFISGEPGHCEAGQRLIIRVMVHPEFESPAPSPSFQPDDGKQNPGPSSSRGPSSPGSPNASSKITAAASFLAAGLGCFLVMFRFV